MYRILIFYIWLVAFSLCRLQCGTLLIAHPNPRYRSKFSNIYRGTSSFISLTLLFDNTSRAKSLLLPLTLLSLCHHFAITLPSFCYDFAITLLLLCYYYAMTLLSFCNHFAITLPSLCCRFAMVLQ